MYVITGATGNTGAPLVQELLRHGHQVRALGRRPERLQPLVELGAEPMTGELEDAAFVEKAFEGADAVYAMIPPKFHAEDFRGYQRLVGQNLAESVRKNGVGHVVTLSSCGAHLGDGGGVVDGLYDLEAAFNHLDAHVLHLRPTFFMENFLGMAGLAATQGIIGFAAVADRPFHFVATDDIASSAASHLHHKDFEGKSVQYLMGERSMTFPEAVGHLGQAVGKSLQYVSFPYQDAENAMIQMGASKDLAAKYTEFSKALNAGRINEKAPLDETTRTPTPIETFARKKFLPAFQAQAQTAGQS
jgi:uncharacterized protein YbjT (DUF2867 family)